jgi:hypothetical protein
VEKIHSMHSRLAPLERIVLQYTHVRTIYPKIRAANSLGSTAEATVKRLNARPDVTLEPVDSIQA